LGEVGGISEGQSQPTKSFPTPRLSEKPVEEKITGRGRRNFITQEKRPSPPYAEKRVVPSVK